MFTFFCLAHHRRDAVRVVGPCRRERSESVDQQERLEDNRIRECVDLQSGREHQDQEDYREN